jgi:aryl-alcohol dehydrogenase-like predicted oxidoreductase
LTNQKISPAHYALQFLATIPEVDFIILGINHLSELEEAESMIKKPLLLSKSEFEKWQINDENFTNPSLWKMQS